MFMDYLEFVKENWVHSAFSAIFVILGSFGGAALGQYPEFKAIKEMTKKHFLFLVGWMILLFCVFVLLSCALRWARS